MLTVPVSRSNYHIGIDPGKSGGLVMLDHRGNILSAEAMPATERDVWDWFEAAIEKQCYNQKITPGTFGVAVIERVGGYMGEGSEAPGSAMFNFGWGYGGLRMALIGHGIPFEDVPPNQWQKALGIAPRKKQGYKFVETKTQFKNRLKAKAQQMFPSIKVTLAIADALLIAVYCQRKHEGRLGR